MKGREIRRGLCGADMFVVITLVILLAVLLTPAIIQSVGPATSPVTSPQSDRVIVQEIGVFQDYDAYSNQRKIFLIKDKSTGKEFIGISGVGISEVGSHQVGKTRSQDER